MSRGFLQFAHNNESFDYVQLAIVSALHIKKFLGGNITLVTDTETEKQFRKTYPQFINLYDQIICNDERQTNNRLYNSRSVEFRNYTRLSAFELSPYDETVVVDVDYLVYSNHLNNLWGSANPFRINRESRTINDLQPRDHRQRLCDTGIDFYWGTVFYFQKCSEIELFFSYVKYIQKNWQYFQNLHGTHERNVRVDHIFSMAIHMFSGHASDLFSVPLPYDRLLDISPTDRIIKIHDSGSLVFGHASGQPVTKITGLDIHVMHKESISDNFERFVELYA